MEGSLQKNKGTKLTLAQKPEEKHSPNWANRGSIMCQLNICRKSVTIIRQRCDSITIQADDNDISRITKIIRTAAFLRLMTLFYRFHCCQEASVFQWTRQFWQIEPFWFLKDSWAWKHFWRYKEWIWKSPCVERHGHHLYQSSSFDVCGDTLRGLLGISKSCHAGNDWRPPDLCEFNVELIFNIDETLFF